MRDLDIIELTKGLAEIIAKELSVSDSDATLTPNQIEVRVREPGYLDLNASVFSVDIFANSYPAREANLDEQRSNIARALRSHPLIPESVINNNSGSVWILLGTGSYEKL